MGLPGAACTIPLPPRNRPESASVPLHPPLHPSAAKRAETAPSGRQSKTNPEPTIRLKKTAKVEKTERIKKKKKKKEGQKRGSS